MVCLCIGITFLFSFGRAGELIFNSLKIEVETPGGTVMTGHGRPASIKCLQEDLAAPGRFYLVVATRLLYMYRTASGWKTELIVGTDRASCQDGKCMSSVI